MGEIQGSFRLLLRRDRSIFVLGEASLAPQVAFLKAHMCEGMLGI